MRHLLEQTDDAKRRMYLLNHFLEQFRGTVFRQTMFAEFELIVHDKANKGEALTSEQLSEIYYGLNKKYYGDGIVVDPLIALEWSAYLTSTARSMCTNTLRASPPPLPSPSRFFLRESLPRGGI